jgi:hypothetical protein
LTEDHTKKGLLGVISETARRKRAAAVSRFKKQSSHEVPRQVFLESTARIAAELEVDGYKYAKSGPHATRRSGDFTFKIWFQSSHNNIADQLVCLWIHATVLSTRIKKWRELQTPPVSEYSYVAGGQIGNLLPKSSWMEWDLANPKRRTHVVSDATTTIQRLAFPYFSLFDRPLELRDTLVEEDLPSMDIARAIEYLICFHGIEYAQRALARFLNARSDLVSDFWRRFREFRDSGLPARKSSGFASSLAYLAVQQGIDVSDVPSA